MQNRLLSICICFIFFPSQRAMTMNLPDTGPYETKHSIFVIDTMDKTNKNVDFYYPLISLDTKNNRKFPLIIYNHGYLGGGNYDYEAYTPLLTKLATYGFIVAFMRSCNAGCADNCKSLHLDPPCFGNFYLEQFKVIDWTSKYGKDDEAKKTSSNIINGTTVYKKIDHTLGYGIAGHSMGGQAALFGSSFLNATNYNIKTVVLHHPYSHELPTPQISFIGFTGTYDFLASPKMVKTIYDNGDNEKHRGFVNKKGSTHIEPLCFTKNCPKSIIVARYTAAWFKLYLENINVETVYDYHNLIYGDRNATESLCGGGDGKMKTCLVL